MSAAETRKSNIVAELEVVRSSDVAAEKFPLSDGATVRIGRVRGNDIVLEDAKTSRFHAILNVSRSSVLVSDLSSLNGTFVNGHRIATPTSLTSGEIITIGDVKIIVRLDGHVDTAESNEMAVHTQAAQFQPVVVTVLVADVCGYTKISESIPGAQVAEMLQLWFSKVSEIVKSHFGVVDKYIGDGVMALWQSPKDEAKSCAEAAVRAAVEIQSHTQALANEQIWPHQTRFPWRCRVCLNTGDALMGTIGSLGTRVITVLGDSVNVAFRLEDIARSLEKSLVLSSTTADLIKDTFAVVELGSKRVKGREEEVLVYSLT